MKAPRTKTKSSSIPAKLMRPQAHAFINRERLFTQLESSRVNSRLTWISAPAGTGKTALIASWIAARKIPCIWYRVDPGDTDPATVFHYLALTGRRHSRRAARLPALTPEFLPTLSLFALRFFEQLFAALRAPFAVVFDDCHELASNATLFNAILPALLDSLPDGGQFVGLSRDPLPSALARWSGNPAFSELGWEKLSFTDTEALSIAKQIAPEAIESAAACNRQTGGWIIGLTLLLRASPADRSRILSNQGLISDRLFEYLAREVFERAPPNTQEVLSVCALFDDIDPDVVTALVDAPAVNILRGQYSCFIEQRMLADSVSYRFHPLFRDFLRARLALTLSADEIAAQKARAAKLLEARGHLEVATALALESHDTELSTRLILAQAPVLMAQGRWATLMQWLLALSDPIRDANEWLLYWMGVALAVSDPARGCPYLERAYTRFLAAGDWSGAWLTVAGIIHGYCIAWNTNHEPILLEWVSVFEKLRSERGGHLPEAIEVPLLTMMRGIPSRWPEHPLSQFLFERAVARTPTLASVEERYTVGAIAVAYLTWRGDEARAREMVRVVVQDRTRASPLLATLWFDVWRGALLWLACRHDDARALLADGLERCRRISPYHQGPYIAHLALNALSAHDYSTAQRILESAPDAINPADDAWDVVGAIRAMWLGLSGQRQAAGVLAHELLASDRWLRAPSEHAYIRCILSVALLEAGALDRAAACAEEAIEQSQRLPSDRLAFEALFLHAQIELERGAEATALLRLERALNIGAAREFRNGLSLWQSDRLTKLLALALRAGIVPDYVRSLIRWRRLPPPADVLISSIWPAGLHVQTLGAFAIHVNGELLGRGGHLQRKPLEVLKALVGLGSGAVNLASLGSQLWPELDGDNAHNACQVAIHRLRKMLRSDSLLEVNHGAAALNYADVWADVEIFRQLAVRIRAALTTRVATAADIERLARELITSYPGHFLPAEEAGWVVTVRERLRSRFVQLATDLSAALERVGSFQVALDLNRHAIELDPLVESFHRGTLQALIALQQYSAAREAFRRCRELLMANLQVEPTAETYELYKRARQPSSRSTGLQISGPAPDADS
jgi:LuxR family maltose regulon positive regulatory protein